MQEFQNTSLLPDTYKYTLCPSGHYSVMWYHSDHRRKNRGCRSCSCTPNIQPVGADNVLCTPNIRRQKSFYFAAHKHRSLFSDLDLVTAAYVIQGSHEKLKTKLQDFSRIFHDKKPSNFQDFEQHIWNNFQKQTDLSGLLHHLQPADSNHFISLCCFPLLDYDICTRVIQ